MESYPRAEFLNGLYRFSLPLSLPLSLPSMHSYVDRIGQPIQ